MTYSPPSEAVAATLGSDREEYEGGEHIKSRKAAEGNRYHSIPTCCPRLFSNVNFTQSQLEKVYICKSAIYAAKVQQFFNIPKL